MDNRIWVICKKCNAKWPTEMLERKGQYSCPLCQEPNMRVMKDGEATEEAWPGPKDAA